MARGVTDRGWCGGPACERAAAIIQKRTDCTEEDWCVWRYHRMRTCVHAHVCVCAYCVCGNAGYMCIHNALLSDAISCRVCNCLWLHQRCQFRIGCFCLRFVDEHKCQSRYIAAFWPTYIVVVVILVAKHLSSNLDCRFELLIGKALLVIFVLLWISRSINWLDLRIYSFLNQLFFSKITNNHI